ncbi:MAG: hypothetical protein OXN89_10485 [Bryobacterales bacterium]|nr:hypothetical protein [Bryobacterales bacterium]
MHPRIESVPEIDTGDGDSPGAWRWAYAAVLAHLAAWIAGLWLLTGAFGDGQ